MWGSSHKTHPFPSETENMTYRILSTVFASREARVVRVPLTEGRRSHKKNDSEDGSVDAARSPECSTLSPPGYWGRGGSVKSGMSGHSPCLYIRICGIQ